MSWQASRPSSPTCCWDPISMPLHYKPFLSGSPNSAETLMRRRPINHDTMLTCYTGYACKYKNLTSNPSQGLTRTWPSLNPIFRHFFALRGLQCTTCKILQWTVSHATRHSPVYIWKQNSKPEDKWWFFKVMSVCHQSHLEKLHFPPSFAAMWKHRKCRDTKGISGWLHE